MRVVRFAPLLVVTLIIGCAHIGGVRDKHQVPPQACNGVGFDFTAHGDGVDPYLDLLSRFNRADAQQRDSIYEKASVAAALKADAHHRLQLALLQLSPGHRGHNRAAAEVLLKSIEDDPGKLSPGAVSLAVSYLQLIKEYNHLKAVNLELENELIDARHKLEAITEIEQTVEPGDENLGETLEP